MVDGCILSGAPKEANKKTAAKNLRCRTNANAVDGARGKGEASSRAQGASWRKIRRGEWEENRRVTNRSPFSCENKIRWTKDNSADQGGDRRTATEDSEDRDRGENMTTSTMIHTRRVDEGKGWLKPSRGKTLGGKKDEHYRKKGGWREKKKEKTPTRVTSLPFG